MGRKQLIDLTLEKMGESERAFAFLSPVTGRKVWMPKAIVEDNGDGTYTMPEAWAVDKELV